MEKLRKYNRIYRICPKSLRGIPRHLLENVADPPKKKKCLSDAEVKVLLSGHTVLEEKVDGGVVGIAWNGEKHLAIGKHSMINYDDNSKKFYGLNSWIYANYEKIQKIPLGWIVYGEWMRSCHQIFYDELPDYFLAFDIWDGYRYFDYNSKKELLKKLGFEMIPAIYRGDNLDVIDVLCVADGLSISNKSRFSSNETFEGLVIKNDNGLVGKYVRKEFIASIEENWIKLPLVENKLKVYKKELIKNPL